MLPKDRDTTHRCRNTAVSVFTCSLIIGPLADFDTYQISQVVMETAG